MKTLVDMLAVLGLTLHLLLVSGRQTTIKDGRPLQWSTGLGFDGPIKKAWPSSGLIQAHG